MSVASNSTNSKYKSKYIGSELTGFNPNKADFKLNRYN